VVGFFGVFKGRKSQFPSHLSAASSGVRNIKYLEAFTFFLLSV
jgi:hypothetical protein